MLFPKTHRCNPIFFCGHAEDELDYDIRAKNEEDASKVFAERCDWNNADWNEARRTVYVESGEKVLKYIVTMEMVPEYTARLAKEDE